MAIIANAEAKRKLRERINSISTILESSDTSSDLYKQLFDELNKAQSEYIKLMYNDDPKFPTAQEVNHQAKFHNLVGSEWNESLLKDKLEAESSPNSDRVNKIRKDLGFDQIQKPDPKEVKETWTKTHEWRTPWRRDFDKMKEEDDLNRRAETLFNKSGLKQTLMQFFLDYARLEAHYEKLRDKYEPDNIDQLEAERLGMSLDTEVASEAAYQVKKSTNGPRPDPII